MTNPKVLKVDDIDFSDDNDYAHTYPMFAYCSKPVNGKVTQLTYFEDCREEIIDNIFEDGLLTAPGTRLRYIVRIITKDKTKRDDVQTNRKAAAGVRLLNIMEKRHKWPLTKLYKINDESYEKHVGFYENLCKFTASRKVIVGSTIWMRSPHMVSLFILIFRLPYESAKFIDIKSYRKLAKTCRGPNRFSDASNLRITFNFWDPIMAEYRYLFRTTKESFDPHSYYDESHYNEGIRTLCTARSNNSGLNIRLKEVAKKVGLEIPVDY